jgi:hypothetical protein
MIFGYEFSMFFPKTAFSLSITRVCHYPLWTLSQVQLAAEGLFKYLIFKILYLSWNKITHLKIDWFLIAFDHFLTSFDMFLTKIYTF